MSLQTTMGQIKVGTRIYVGFLAVLILLGTVGLVGWFRPFGRGDRRR